MNKVLSNLKLVGIVLISFIVITFSSCAKKMVFSTSSVTPAAVGSVKINTDDNKNHTIEVDVINLAPVDQLTPPKKTYVVWMVADNNETQNIGQLKSSSGFLTKAFKASLNTVTSIKPVSFFITAEDEGNVKYPGTMLVLRTQ